MKKFTVNIHMDSHETWEVFAEDKTEAELNYEKGILIREKVNSSSIEVEED